MADDTKVVFVPGSCHPPACFGKVMHELAAAGYACRGVDLPTVGARSEHMTIADDTAQIRATVIKAIEESSQVVVVCHSYGGVPANNALQGLGHAERKAAGKTSGVASIVMISSMLVPVGWRGQSMPPHKPWQAVKGNAWRTVGAEDVFYHDLEPADAAYWAEQLQPTRDLRSDPTSTTYAAWKVIPIFYLICDDDRALAPLAQEAFVSGAKEQGATVIIEHCFASHSPFLSMPATVTKLIRRAAGETLP